jgi:RNA polymerase sigma-70 factor (sigma-E family)
VKTIMLAIPEEAPIRGHTVDADTALEQLYAGHYAGLVRLAVLLLRDQGLAEDVVQDSFVAMHRRWDRIDPAKAPAYLRQTVVNRSRSALRHRTVVGRHQPEPLPDGAPADNAVLEAEHRAAVLDALAELPTRQREVLALRYYLDLSEADIATTLGISRGAVKSHASRAAAALRERLSLKEDS